MSFSSSFVISSTRTGFLGLLLIAGLTACSTTPYEKTAHVGLPSAKPLTAPQQTAKVRPVIVSARTSLQCVAHARTLSGISLRGDAWTWWQSARGKYERGAKPKRGSVLVLSRTEKLRYGHIAYVTKVLSKREIQVEHANWLNQGKIHKHQIVRDVSARGDWSEVKVWYTPGQVLGKRTYAVSGFVYKARTPGVSA